jgi:hypothetical protein
MIVASAGSGDSGVRRALQVIGIGVGAFALASVAGIAGMALLRRNEHSLPHNGPESAV